MRRTADEHLIERYLGGELSGAEEQEFFMRVAVDSNLRQTLKAYRIVETAIRKHRDSIAPEHSGSRLRLIGMLEHPVGMPQTAAAIPASEPVAQGGLLNRLGWRWLGMGVVAAALVTAVALFPSRSQEPSPLPILQPTAVQHQAPDRQQAEQSAPATTTTAATRATGKTPPTRQPVEPSGSQSAGRAPVSTAPATDTRRQVPHVESVMPKTITPSVDVRSEEEKPAQPVLRSTAKQQHPVATPDTIKMRMKIALPDMKQE